jgi:hypothetical protein
MVLLGLLPCLDRKMATFGEPEHRRFMVRPGMTSLWEVNGSPNLPWCDALKADLSCVDNWSSVLEGHIARSSSRLNSRHPLVRLHLASNFLAVVGTNHALQARTCPRLAAK